ncbi:MAG: catalase [Bryobacteraceae bacterium]
MLNPNHGNCFAKIGQAAFNPAHFVPGIGPSPDKMLQGRLFFLPNDTHCCRLGAYHTVLASQPPRAFQAGQLQPRRLNAHRRRWGNNYEDSIASAARNEPLLNPARVRMSLDCENV